MQEYSRIQRARHSRIVVAVSSPTTFYSTNQLPHNAQFSHLLFSWSHPSRDVRRSAYRLLRRQIRFTRRQQQQQDYPQYQVPADSGVTVPLRRRKTDAVFLLGNHRRLSYSSRSVSLHSKEFIMYAIWTFQNDIIGNIIISPPSCWNRFTIWMLNTNPGEVSEKICRLRCRHDKKKECRN